MIKLDRRSAVRLGLIAASIAVAAYLLSSSGILDIAMDRQRLTHFFREHRAYASLLFIGLQALQVVAAPVPGEVTGFVGGLIFGSFWGIVYSTIGLTLGSWAAFLLARWLGRPLVERIARPETIRRYDYVMKHKGQFLAFLLFLIPGFPKDLLCYILGLGHMGQREFLLVSTSGRLLGTTLLTVGGSFFREARYGAFFTVVGIGIGAILLVMIYRENIERWFRGMRAAERRRERAARKKKKEKA